MIRRKPKPSEPSRGIIIINKGTGLLQAYKKVRANKGSGGVDDMDWEWLDNNLKT